MQRYIREHDAGQQAARILYGLEQITRVAKGSYGYAKYIVMYAVVLGAIAIARPRTYARALRNGGAVWLFAMMYLGGYAVLYAWYAPIESGNRLLLAGLLPLLICLQVALGVGLRGVSIQIRNRNIDAYTLVCACALVVLAFDIPGLVWIRAPVVFGGE